MIDIKLSLNTNNVFRMDVYRGAGSCALGALCSGIADAVSEAAGECPCSPDTPGPGVKKCLNHGAVYLVRVYRAAGADVRCGDTYTLDIKNGT